MMPGNRSLMPTGAINASMDVRVPPSAIRIVPNGVDTSLFRPLPTVARNPHQIIATASADAPLKGLSVLLHAFHSLCATWPDLRLVLIARPRSGGDTEALINRLELSERIRFVSDASHDDINRLYAESAVAVVPVAPKTPSLLAPKNTLWKIGKCSK